LGVLESYWACLNTKTCENSRTQCIVILSLYNLAWYSFVCVCGIDFRLSLAGVPDFNGRVSAGLVQVTFNNITGTICDFMWDDNDAAVVCKMLGFRWVFFANLCRPISQRYRCKWVFIGLSVNCIRLQPYDFALYKNN